MRIDDWLDQAKARVIALQPDTKGSTDDGFTFDDGEREARPHRSFFWRPVHIDPSKGFQDRHIASGQQFVMQYDAAPGVDKQVRQDGERFVALFENANTWIEDGTCFAVICGSWIVGPARSGVGIECTMDQRVEYALTGV